MCVITSQGDYHMASLQKPRHPLKGLSAYRAVPAQSEQISELQMGHLGLDVLASRTCATGLHRTKPTNIT